MLSDFLVFTVFDREHPGVERLIRSAKRFRWPLKLIRLAPRTNLLKVKHLEIRGVLDQYEPKSFLFLDAFDTAFIRPYEPFEANKLTFGGELNCYPEKQYAPVFEQRYSTGPFPYLNSGVIWGEASHYCALCPDYHCHDQLAWTRAAVENPSINIDSFGSFAMNIHSTKPGDWAYLEGKWTYLLTNMTPYIIHANGHWPMPAWAES